MRRVQWALPVILCAVAACPLTGRAAPDPGPVELSSDWFCRWGDPPTGGGPASWLSEDVPGPGWAPTATLENPAGNRERWMWLRVRLPSTPIPNPALFVPRMAKAFEVYVDTSLVYTNGEFAPGANHYFNIKSHLFSMPQDFQGRVLTFRIYSDGPRIGMTAGDVPVTLGSETDLVGVVMRRSLEHNIAGAIIFIIGLLVVTGNRLLEWKARTLFPLSLGVALVAIGVFFITTRFASAFLIDVPPLLYYLHFCSYLIFPIGLYAFVNEIVGPKSILRPVWWLSLVFAGVLILLDVAGVKPMSEMATPINLWLLITLLAMIAVVLRRSRQGRTEARHVLWAILVVAAVGVYDLLAKLGVVPFYRYLAHWGLVFFACLLVLVVVRRYNYFTARLERQSAELQEYATGLEEKVASRTRDLDERNAELEAALRELEDTQQQLIIREKMASIGDLVAGVAHEINTPIGAVISATDGSRRGIDIIKATLDGKGDMPESDGNSRFRKAVAIVDANNDIVMSASTRVAGIVRTLKNFARLDEAEVQRADLHEGIDNTLTLLDHELKQGVDVRRDFGDIPPVECIPSQINQVFMNVLHNACQAVGDSGMIEIVTKRDADRVVISISDTGPGIAVEHSGRIFDPGFTTKGVGVGTGLGLSISYKIVARHNGTITAANRDGGGAVFTITLPIDADPGQDLAEI